MSNFFFIKVKNYCNCVYVAESSAILRSQNFITLLKDKGIFFRYFKSYTLLLSSSEKSPFSLHLYNDSKNFCHHWKQGWKMFELDCSKHLVTSQTVSFQLEFHFGTGNVEIILLRYISGHLELKFSLNRFKTSLAYHFLTI